EMLDRLVGRTVFAEADAVVGEDVNDAEAAHRRQANGGSHVIRERQERSSKRNETPVQGYPVGDRAHRMLADAKVDVAALKVPGSDVALVLEIREVRGGEVRRAADQRLDPLGNGVEHAAG